MSWTDDRVKKLRKLWSDGMSASQIAKALGGVTRNAVIGKAHRQGFLKRGEDGPDQERDAEKPGPEKSARKKSEPAKKPAPKAKAAKPPPPKPTPEPEPVPAAPQRVAPVIRDASQPRAPGPPTPEEVAARATLVEIEKMAKKLDLLKLTERTCKWPIGDPAEQNFFFCGLPCDPSKPYCEHHIAIAFQPMSARRDRPRANR